MFKILFATQGYFNPLLRVSEPAFYQIVSKKLKSALCSRRKIEEQRASLQAAEDQKFASRASHFVSRNSSDIQKISVSDGSFLSTNELLSPSGQPASLVKGDCSEETFGEGEQELPPLMIFLASSLNVELVYLILTGLT